MPSAGSGFSIGSLRLPESPVWQKKRNVANIANIANANVANSQLELGIGTGNDSTLATVDKLLSRRYVVPFLLAVAVLTLNKTTGMSSVTSYSVMIFQKAGFAGTLGNVGDFAIKFTNPVVTLVAASLVDKEGRTWLLKVGTAGMTIGLTVPAE